MSEAMARVYVNGALVFRGAVRAEAPFSVTACETDGVTEDAELGIAWLSEEQKKQHAAEIDALRRLPREALGLSKPDPRPGAGELQLVLLMVAAELSKSELIRFRSGDRVRICLDG